MTKDQIMFALWQAISLNSDIEADSRDSVLFKDVQSVEFRDDKIVLKTGKNTAVITVDVT